MTHVPSLERHTAECGGDKLVAVTLAQLGHAYLYAWCSLPLYVKA